MISSDLPSSTSCTTFSIVGICAPSRAHAGRPAGRSKVFRRVWWGEAAVRAVPQYAPFLGLFLGRDTRYRFVRTSGEAVWLHAGEGAEQGDVWGAVIYSLALAPRVAELER